MNSKQKCTKYIIFDETVYGFMTIHYPYLQYCLMYNTALYNMLLQHTHMVARQRG